jgi:hypothetical protein
MLSAEVRRFGHTDYEPGGMEGNYTKVHVCGKSPPHSGELRERSLTRLNCAGFGMTPSIAPNIQGRQARLLSLIL